jgi:hypothetical protein
MRADGAQELSNQGQRRLQVLWIRSKPDAEIAVHVEVVPGNEQDALFEAQALGQLRRSKGVRVPDERDRSRFGRDMAETVLPLDPRLDDWVVRPDDRAGAREEGGTARRFERNAREPVVDPARRDRRVVVDGPQRVDHRRRRDNPTDAKSR